jgi:O-antigen/teichoic acid export membrane protein
MASAHPKVNPDKSTLTSGRLLARNTIWNLLGNGAPLLIAVVAIPILIRELGKDRFGILALVWAVIGYASLFDLGLGRALTQMVAQKLGADEHDDVPGLVWTSLILMTMLGVVGGIVMAAVSPWLVDRALHVPSALQTETLRSFYLLSFSVPIVVGTAGLRGFLEAHQRFDVVNYLRIPTGIFAFAGPLLALPFSKTLPPVVAILLLGRIASWIAYLLFCMRISPALRERILWHRHAVGPLMKFGGWMTVSNVIGPIMVTMDRFVIGAVLSVTAVAYYATPYEAITRLWIIPSSVVAVVFPAFSATFAGDRERTAALYDRSVKYILISLFPVVLTVILFAPEILRVWLGAEFAAHSTAPLQWLTIGVFVSSLSLVPLALVQGSGRPDLTAKLHMLELPIYLIALFLLIQSHGIEGAALAWTGRVCLDAVVLFVMPPFLREQQPALRFRTSALVALAPIALGCATLLHDFGAKLACLAAVLTVFAAASWFLILTREERQIAQRLRYPARVYHSFSSQ